MYFYFIFFFQKDQHKFIIFFHKMCDMRHVNVCICIIHFFSSSSSNTYYYYCSSSFLKKYRLKIPPKASLSYIQHTSHCLCHTDCITISCIIKPKKKSFFKYVMCMCLYICGWWARKSSYLILILWCKFFSCSIFYCIYVVIYDNCNLASNKLKKNIHIEKWTRSSLSYFFLSVAYGLCVFVDVCIRGLNEFEREHVICGLYPFMTYLKIHSRIIETHEFWRT